MRSKKSGYEHDENMMLKYLARGLLKLCAWKVVGCLNNKIKQVVIIAPHTSNWDAVILLMVKWAYSYTARGLGKKELFKVPGLAHFFYWIGIYPVDRSQPHNLVYDLVRKIKNEKIAVSLCLAPEGTRSWVAKWRSGFYYIALKAELPITCVSLDYPSRTVEFSHSFLPSGQIEEDMKIIVSFYKNKKGKNPKQQGPLVL